MKIRHVLFLGCLSTLPAWLIAGTGNPLRHTPVLSTAGSPAATYLDVNNIATVLRDDGIADIDVNQANAGLVFPRGSGKTAVFQSGFLWGGKVNGEIRIGGSVYRTGLQPGKIISPGIAEDPNLAKNRIYRVRPDYVVADLSAEFGTEGTDPAAIRTQYRADWEAWPAADGAPFTDVDHNGAYDPAIDIPGIPGASQTVWFVSNDLNQPLTQNLYGSNPIGLELQVTLWEYHSAGMLGDVIFKKYVLINKSILPVTDLYLSQWSDPDIGNSIDDFAGCDTALGIGYVYNSTDNDATYSPLPPPAVGYTFLQGPMVPSPGDSVMFLGRRVYDRKNLPMTACYYFARGDSTVTDPVMGDSKGTTEFYNFLQGRIGKSGNPFINPVTGQPTTFVLTGDPITGTGWLDGQVLPAGDRRIGLSSGPITLAAGDTQEVIIAFAAGMGTDNLSSITALKNTVRMITPFYRENRPIAGIMPLPAVVPVHDTLFVRGTAMVYRGQVTNTRWQLIERPDSSLAGIQSAGPDDAIIAADVPGTYRLAFIAVSAGGAADTASAEFRAVDNRPPVAVIGGLSDITLGGSLFLDGSGSYDPDGDSLHYAWSVQGGKYSDYPIYSTDDTTAGYLHHPASSSATFRPVRAARDRIRLDVTDGLFTGSTYTDVDVKPLEVPGSLLIRRFGTENVNSYYWGWGPVRRFGSDLWMNYGGMLMTLDLNDFNHPRRHYQLYTTGNYIVDGSFIAVAGGVHGAWLYHAYGDSIVSFPDVRIDPDGSLTGSPDTMVTDLYCRHPYLFIPDGLAGLYVYNISDPFSPVFVSHYSNGRHWGNFVVQGNRLFTLHSPNREISVVDITNPSAVAPVATIPLAGDYYGIRISGNTLYLYSYLVVSIYDISNLAAPVLMASIDVGSTLGPNNIFDIAVSGGVLAIGTNEGTYLYDVTNGAEPVLRGKYLTGTPHLHVYADSLMLLAQNQDPNRGLPGRYEGLLQFDPSPILGVPSSGTTLPAAYRLHQNSPNPFNPSTVIRFELPAESRVSMRIYNAVGQLVTTLIDGTRQAGRQQVSWEPRNLGSGIYYCRLEATPVSGRGDTFAGVRKMVFVK